MTAEPALPALSDAVAHGPAALFELLAGRLRQRVGYMLLTVLVPAPDSPWLMRVFTSNDRQYPLGKADPIEDTSWFRRLFAEREAIVANDAGEIAEWLPGFDVFAEQGYGSLANLPVVVDGRTIGLLNMMDEAGHFTTERMAGLRHELPVAALAILASTRLEPPGGAAGA